MSFYRDTVRKARKEHRCDMCHGIIKAGEKYHDKAGNAANDENEVCWGRECMACQPVIEEYINSDMYDNCEGYCDEYIQEWWQNVKCYDCKHRYLPCKLYDGCDCMKNGICTEKTKYGTCGADDTCDEMTHFCRCEKYESGSEVEKDVE